MINTTVAEALNNQIQAEFYSAYLYLAMSANFEHRNLRGFANWMRVQFQEEQMHALRLYDYLIARGGQVRLQAIDAPPADWDTPEAAFAAVLEHERHVSALINKLVDLAVKQSDHATTAALQWFVNEQVEEEATAEQLLEEVLLVRDNPGGLFMIDRELAGRTFNPPPAAGA